MMDPENIEIDQENISENEKKTKAEVPRDKSRKRKHKKLKKKNKKGTDDEEETTEKRKEQGAVNKSLRDDEKDEENEEEVNEDGENTTPKNHKAGKRRRKRGKSKKRKQRDNDNSEENEEDEDNKGDENLISSDAVKTTTYKANETHRERNRRNEERSSRKASDDEESEENNEDMDNVQNHDKLSSDDKSIAGDKEDSNDNIDDFKMKDDDEEFNFDDYSDDEGCGFLFSVASDFSKDKHGELRWFSSDDDEILKCKDADIQDHMNLRDKIYECKTFADIDIKEAYGGDQIKEGQRVVLSSEYEHKNKEDKGIGLVGTIIKVEEDTVRVLWDSEKAYKTYNTSGDLLLLDNAQTGAIHNGYKCNGCKENPIRGMKWSCCLCKDIHLCTHCYMRGKHSLCHEFERKLYQKSQSIKVGIRSDYFEPKNFKYLKGLTPGAKVALRSDVNATGTVKKLMDKKVKFFNCDAFVKRDNDNKDEVRYRVGREGQVDLKFLTPGKGLAYYEDHLQIITKDDARPGMRVVAKNRTSKNEQVVGTIIFRKNQNASSNMPTLPGMVQNSSEKDTKLMVQWDDGSIGNEIENDEQILLYDNSQLGVEHDTRCKGCEQDIKGIRWQGTGYEYSLCTSCYMSDEGDMDCIFSRMVEPFQSKELPNSRSTIGSDRKIQANGLFKDAEVSEIGNEKIIGKISRISKYKQNASRNQVYVKWDSGYLGEYNVQITDLILDGNSKDFIYFASHLPKVQKDLNGYIKIAYRDKKITVDIRFGDEGKSQIKQEKRLPFFLLGKKTNVDSMDISKRQELPCLDIHEKVLCFKGIVIVHPQTEKSTIKDLLNEATGFLRGNTDEKESLVGYFQRMAEAHYGWILIPVVLSLGSKFLDRQTVKNVTADTIPVVFFKATGNYASVSLLDENDKGSESFPKLATVCEFDVGTPWKIKHIKKQLYFVVDKEKDKNSWTSVGYSRNLDAMVCCMLIAVSSAVKIREKADDFKESYSNALSMYLLKRGKWKFPIDLTEDFFNQRSIEFVFEKNLEEEFEKGLWSDLKKSTKNAYKPPVWKNEGKKVDIGDRNFYGFVFLALLKRNLFRGATQLLKLGYVHIHYILIGCVILRDAADDWKLNGVDKENLLSLKKTFSIHALRIISYIHENDKDINRVKRRALEHNRGEHPILKKRLGKNIHHAGRLLLNHGYLKDAIRTKNTIFLENIVVKNILNHVWYGGELLNVKRVAKFLFLTVFHFIFLPILMITMEGRPFKWFYRQYEIPFSKVCLNVFSHLILLVGYAYMLLFDFDKGVSSTDVFIIFWMANFFTDELKQMIVAKIRQNMDHYFSEKWNYLDWLSIVIYICGMLVKLGDGNEYLDTSKILLVITYIMLCVRILHMFSLSTLLGPKLVMIQKMFLDTFAFMTIMFVILMCFNVSYYSILYGEKSEFTYNEIVKIAGNGYWILFGELNLDGDKLEEPDCTLDHALYSNGTMERCPSALGREFAPYLKAFYVMITVILLLNLLIAMYSYTFSKVHEKSTLYWSQLQTDFLDEFSVKTIFPVHMALLSMLFFAIQASAWVLFHLIRKLFVKCCDPPSETTEEKMFLRVFLYDSSYHIKHKKTSHVENRAAFMTRGELEIPKVKKDSEESESESDSD